MEALALLGFEVIVGIVVSLALTAIGLFFGNICLFESIAAGIILGMVARHAWLFHAGVAVAMGIAAVALLYSMQNTPVGFWALGGLLSVARGFIACLAAML